MLFRSNFEGKTSGLKNLQLDNALKAIEIPDYTLEQQNRIAETLLKIEQKMVLNRQLNHNLPLPDHSLREARVRLAA